MVWSTAVSVEIRRGLVPPFLKLDHPTGRDASKRSPKSGAIGTLSVGKREDGYDELLANIRRLTVTVLDNLEAGSRDRTLDQGQKRLLSNTGAWLLRLWRVVLREGGSQRIAEDFGIIEGLLSTVGSVGQEGVQNGQ